jgi:cyclophilin family peptidyl-prolyl cis-trans isomerase
MKRIVVVLGVAAVMAAAVALTAATAFAQATPVTVNERIPISGEGENPCTGETFTFEGTLHLVVHVTYDGNESHHVINQLNLQGRGVSPSGAKYVLGLVEHGGQNITFEDETHAEIAKSNHTATSTIKVLRQGEDGTTEDFMARFIFHVTQNANGEWTAEVLQGEAECK